MYVCTYVCMQKHLALVFIISTNPVNCKHLTALTFQLLFISGQGGKYQIWREAVEREREMERRNDSVIYFGRKCEVSGGQICGQRQTSGNCRTCCLCQRAQTPGPPPPTLYHMYLWHSQPASHQPRLPEGMKEGWRERKKVVVKEGWEETLNYRQER